MQLPLAKEDRGASRNKRHRNTFDYSEPTKTEKNRHFKAANPVLWTDWIDNNVHLTALPAISVRLTLADSQWVSMKKQPANTMTDRLQRG